MGLTIAADVARRLGGDLSVDTVYGKYTEFAMSISVADVTPPDAEEAEEAD